MYLLKFSNEELVFFFMLIFSILIVLFFYIIILFYIKRIFVVLFQKSFIFGGIYKRLKMEFQKCIEGSYLKFQFCFFFYNDKIYGKNFCFQIKLKFFFYVVLL